METNVDLYAFPSVDDSVERERLCGKYKTNGNYPFFEESDGQKIANPNLIGTDILIELNGNKYYVNDSLCSYNVYATHKSGTTVNLLNCTALNNNPTVLAHQIIDDGNYEVVVSGKDLYHVLSGVTIKNDTFTVEYLSKDFEQITKIENGLFSNTDILTIKLPYCVKLVSTSCSDNPDDYSGLTIGEGAFSGCTELKEFYCYHTVSKVENAAFSGCTSLIGNEIACNDKIGINYNDKNTQLISNHENGDDLRNCLKVCFDCGNNSFNGCTSISSITFFNSSVNYEIFGNENFCIDNDNAECNIHKIAPHPIYDGKYKIGSYAFANCTNLKKINGYFINNSDKYEDDGNRMTIPKNINLSGGTYCFANCTSLSGMLEFENITSNNCIPEGAFSGCTGITSLQSYNKLGSGQDIGDHAFANTSIPKQKSELQNIANNVTDDDVDRIFY